MAWRWQSGFNILRAQRRGPPQNCMATSLIVASGQRQRSVEFEKVLSEPILQNFQ